MNSKNLSWLLYDIEIVNCIPQRGVQNDPRFTYCEGWHDHQNMGISCISVYTNWDNAYRVFASHEFPDFQWLVSESDLVIGFNSVSFDDKVCAANGLQVTTNYDLLCETWVAAGLPAVFTPGTTTSGYSLEKLAQANFGFGKSGDGALAAALWQDGRHQRVYAYCLQDVFLSVQILRRGLSGALIDPNTQDLLQLRSLS